jgi:hypothetical protein
MMGGDFDFIYVTLCIKSRALVKLCIELVFTYSVLRAMRRQGQTDQPRAWGGTVFFFLASTY